MCKAVYKTGTEQKEREDEMNWSGESAEFERLYLVIPNVIIPKN